MIKTYILIFSQLFYFDKLLAQTDSKFFLIPLLSMKSENVEWSISGDKNGRNPNYLSELKWRNLVSSTGIAAGYSIRKVSLVSEFVFGKTIRGLVSDIDYKYDNRNGVSYSEKFSSSGSNQYFINTEAKYFLISNVFSIKLGYQHGFFRNFLNHDFEKSEYKIYMNSIGLGTNYLINTNKRYSLNNEFFFVYNFYNGYGNWVLRDDLMHPKSFVHKINLIGFFINESVKIKLDNNTNLIANLKLNFNKGVNGEDVLFYKSGSTSDTMLKEVKLNSVEFGLRLEWFLF